MKPRENAGLVAGTDEAPAYNEMVLSVEAGSRKILIRRGYIFIRGGQWVPAQNQKPYIITSNRAADKTCLTGWTQRLVTSLDYVVGCGEVSQLNDFVLHTSQ